MIFTSVRNEITCRPAQPPAPLPVSPDQRRYRFGSGRRQYRSRSVLGLLPPARLLPWRPVPLNDVERRLILRNPDRSSPPQNFGLAPGPRSIVGVAISSAIREPHRDGAP